jgi:hypothetical protein
MGHIAVQQDELIPGGCVKLIVQFHLAAAIDDMHQEKTVIAAPLELVTGLIIKIAGCNRIQIDL